MVNAFDLYELYFTELKNLQEGYLGFVITMSLTIITVIGWFLTSDNPQKVKNKNKSAAPVFFVTIILTAALEKRFVRSCWKQPMFIPSFVCQPVSFMPME